MPFCSKLPAALQQRDRAVTGLHARPVQMIVIVGRLVKGEVHGERLLVDQAADVVLHQFALDRMDPLNGNTQQFGQQQDRGEGAGQQQGRAQVWTRPAVPHGGHQTVDQVARQVNGRARQHALNGQQPIQPSVQPGAAAHTSPSACPK
jgi:hypothetical protein